MSILTLLVAKGLSDQFSLILDNLCKAIAARSAPRPALTPFYVQVWSKLRRTMRRFARLAERAALGKVPPPRQPRPVTTDPRPDPIADSIPATPTKTRVRFPDSYAWLCKFLPYEAAQYGNQLQHMITTPEMAALIEADPQVGRLLRPLCRMLAANPGPLLVQPAKPKPVRGSPTPKPRPPRPVIGHSPALRFDRFVLARRRSFRDA